MEKHTQDQLQDTKANFKSFLQDEVRKATEDFKNSSVSHCEALKQDLCAYVATLKAELTQAQQDNPPIKIAARWTNVNPEQAEKWIRGSQTNQESADVSTIQGDNGDTNNRKTINDHSQVHTKTIHAHHAKPSI
jgi:hypothetical protein